MKKFSTLCIILLLALSFPGQGQKTWTGTTSTAWNVSTNWSPSGVPSSSDNVTIPSAPSNQPVLSGISGSCNNLTINSGASLSISATSLNTATLTASGTVTVNGAISLGGTVTKAGKLVAVNITWSSTATFSGYLNGSFDISGNWEFGTGSSAAMGLCPVNLVGSTHTNIISKSSSSSFGSVILNKNAGYYAYISATSTTSLKLTGSLTINASNKFYGEGNITTILLANLNSSGNYYFNAGTVSMEKSSGTQTIQVNTGDYFNSLQINGGSTVTLNNTVHIHDDVIIQSGTFDPLNNTIYVTGDWVNTAGAANFTEGTGRVVFYREVTNKGPAALDNYCNYSENFYILELSNQGGYLIINSSSATVTCNQYDYTYGGIKVQEGTFTAYDLADAGLYGYYGVEDGGTINLTNTGSYVDLAGNLNISGGNFNVYGGLDDSYWPNGSNATITMSGGTLNFADNGINIVNHATYNLVESITGGTIRTTGNFVNSRSDFTPAGGTIEMYGTADANLSCNTGVMHSFTINKATSGIVTMTGHLSSGGILTVEEGTLKADAKVVICSDDLNISSGGTLWLENASYLDMAGGNGLNVSNGGTLKLLGTSGSKPTVTRLNSSAPPHEIQIHGTISAKYAIFEYNHGVNIWSDATIDPLNPFDNCTFQNGVDRFLMIANNQTVTIRNAGFPTLPLYENVSKTNNAGRITFKDATGAYAGAAYENDPYDRVDWVASQPGLWTGLVSTDWFNTGNWDDLTVPTSATDVTIPTGAPNMPVLSSGSPVCNNLTITGTLTIRAVTMQVNGSLAVNGTLAMNNASGILNVLGNVSWNSLSVASISAAATINVYGNWTFNVGANAQLGNGTVYFKGSTSKTITSLSDNCSFWNLTTNKTGLAVTEFSSSSTQPLTINGGFTVLVNSKFISSNSGYINVKGNLTSGGIIQCNAGRVNLNGVSQVITPNTSDYFYHLDLNQSGTVTISNTYTNVLNIKGGLLIYSGIFNAGNNTINIGGDFYCMAGAGGFAEGYSHVFFDGLGTQNIYNDETFNILELNKASGELMINGRTVTCNIYNWTAGSIRVANGGVFTALDLAEDGLRGGYLAHSGSTMNLYQDAVQHVDLGGNMSITDGSTINVFGGNGSSQWPVGGDAAIYMEEGTLDFKNAGININSLGTNTLAIDISGGTIRTPGLFFCNRPDFDPSGGTVEMYGPDNTTLEMYAGSLNSLYINKASVLAPLSGTVTLSSDITINGILWAGPGTFRATGKTITTNGTISIENGGTFWLENGSILKLVGNQLLNVQQGGLLKVTGTASSKPMITRHGATGNYLVQVDGMISARNAIFQYTEGIMIYETGSVDPANPFDSCTFRNGVFQFLNFDNSQSLIIRGADFPTATATYNVWKSYNAGRITFKDATGAFSGPAYELDPYDRVDWSATQPGLWTGLVSTEWNTAGNWDDLKVPTSTTDVTIPVTAPNMPVVGTVNANCNNITVNGILTIETKKLTVAGNISVSGTLAMHHSLGSLVVTGNVSFLPGSSADITANAYITVYGNWMFYAGSDAILTHGSVSFAGTSNTWFGNESATSTFGDVYVSKTGGAYLTVEPTIEDPIRIKGFYVEINSHFILPANDTLIVSGNFYSFSTTELNGAVVFDGVDQLIIPHPDAYFTDVIFDQTGSVTINQTNTNILRVMNDVTINSGIFSPGNSIIEVGGDWRNNVGTAAFNEGTSRVRFNSTNYGQACTTEDFYILEVDIADGHFYSLIYSDITCQVYDWTDGGLHIDGTGSSFYAADLADNGIYGDNIIRRSVELHQDASQSVDVIGNITINSPAGVLTIYGGNDQSNWGVNGNASLTMTSGIMDFVNQSVRFIDTPPYSFTSAISGGKIRSSGGVMVQSPGFSPTGGEVEIYGNSGGMLVASDGGSFYNLTVNKASTTPTVTLFNTLINNDFQVSKGYCYIAFENVMECRGDIDVNNGGWFSVHGSTLKLGNLSTLYVHSGGQLSSEGWAGGGEGIFTSNYPSAYYSVNIESGAWLLMHDAIVENVGGNGFYMAPGSIGLGSNLFHNCIFRNGQPGANALLTIDNSQDLTIDFAEFTSTPWGSQYNVRKTSNTGTLTFTNYSGNFAGETYEDDPDNRIHWVSEPSLLLNSLFLQGLYDGNKLMHQAYDDMGPHWPAGVADHVTVELHDPGNYANIHYSFADVELSTSGMAVVPVSTISAGDYYLTIRHRNSIETVSAAPVPFTGSTLTYGFGSPSQVYGDNLLNWNGTGTYVIWGADINQDGIVDGSDMNEADNASTAITFGYVPEDVNGDGLVDGSDINMVDNNLTSIVMAYLP